MSKKRCKHKCELCDECIPIGEGDCICGKTDKLVIEEYSPTDDYRLCSYVYTLKI